jgi:hypothetical protein
MVRQKSDRLASLARVRACSEAFNLRRNGIKKWISNRVVPVALQLTKHLQQGCQDGPFALWPSHPILTVVFCSTVRLSEAPSGMKTSWVLLTACCVLMVCTGGPARAPPPCQPRPCSPLPLPSITIQTDSAMGISAEAGLWSIRIPWFYRCCECCHAVHVA